MAALPLRAGVVVPPVAVRGFGPAAVYQTKPATPATAATVGAALLALAVLEPTRLGLPRKALWLLALAFVVAA